MTTTVTVEVHDAPPERTDTLVIAKYKGHESYVCLPSRSVNNSWHMFTHWHLPIDVTTLNKDQQ